MTDDEKMKEEEKREEAEEEKAEDKETDKKAFSHKLPPADFLSIITMFFQLPAMQFLGELRDPSSSEEVEVNPALAKYYIDCIAVLDEKTRGNLGEEERKALDNMLTQLRLLYVKNTPADAKMDRDQKGRGAGRK